MIFNNRVKELESKFEELTNKVKSLENELTETQETLDFALEFGKDTVTAWVYYEKDPYIFDMHNLPHYGYNCCIYAKYIKNGKLCRVKEKVPYHIDEKSVSIEKNLKGTYIIKCKLESKKENYVYFQLVKDTGIIIDLNTIYESFGDVLQNLYSARKQKTQKKSKSTEKCSEKCDFEKKTSKKRRSKNA